MIIGLTGKSCAGKDTVASMLPSDRFSVIDVDGLGHQALESNHEKLRAAFGDGIFRKDGTVDRKILGPIVFSDPEKLETLNSITHPWMVEEAIREAKENLAKGDLVPTKDYHGAARLREKTPEEVAAEHEARKITV